MRSRPRSAMPTLAEDLAVIRSMRRAVGDDFAIMVDYNQSLGVPAAIRRGLALQELGVAWIEEPTLQYDYAGHQRIQSALDVPVQMGENWFGPEEMFKALNAGACRLAMPDAMKIGGVTGWLRASALAQQFGLPYVQSPLPGNKCAPAGSISDCTLAGASGSCR